MNILNTLSWLFGVDGLKQFFLGLLFMLPVLLISLTLHEFSHAAMAYALGDPTAKYNGRLTLNPIRHLDPLGAVMMVLFRFGWAKPVPVNPMNFKNRKGGMALTALAGPLSNIVLAFVCELLFVKVPAIRSNWISYEFFYYMIASNIMLCFFNLIPINPLDGSRILALFLPESAEMFLYRYEGVLNVLIIVLMFTGFLSKPLGWIMNNVMHNFAAAINLLPF